MQLFFFKYNKEKEKIGRCWGDLKKEKEKKAVKCLVDKYNREFFLSSVSVDKFKKKLMLQSGVKEHKINEVSS